VMLRWMRRMSREASGKMAPRGGTTAGTSQMTTLQAATQSQLRQFVEQIERLEEEKKAITDDIRDKYTEAKAVGFDVKALRQIVRLRKKSKTDRQEEEAILATYMHALGMLEEMPAADSMMAAE
jgi:uncharacterized protein (UPF0335 family)